MLGAFGAVHQLFNNAGVFTGWRCLWDCASGDWDWMWSVNLWGVIHGIRTFLPVMLQQSATDSLTVNTASLGGLVSPEGLGIYAATKHAVVALSEALYHELKHIGAGVTVSVLCPGQVDTRIDEADRNRPVGMPATYP
jgi:NADP-dependent 3-hydroxy acid dehydrogenase YdfG